MKNTLRSTVADSGPKPPKGLSDPAAKWWRLLTNEYAIDDRAGLFLLEQALLAFDRVNGASALIAKHGEVTQDRFGQLRANPACSVERDARAAMITAFKLLNLAVEPLHDGAGQTLRDMRCRRIAGRWSGDAAGD